MDQLNFTPEEKQLLQRIAADGRVSYMFAYASILFGPIVFAIYGFAKQDPSAITTAFLALLIIFLWSISRNARDSKVLSSICARLLAPDKGGVERK